MNEIYKVVSNTDWSAEYRRAIPVGTLCYRLDIERWKPLIEVDHPYAPGTKLDSFTAGTRYFRKFE